MSKVSMSFEQRIELQSKLFSLLLRSSGLTKYDLHEMLSTDDENTFSTSEINSVLYGNPRVFSKGFEKLPRWYANHALTETILNLTKPETPAIDFSFYKGHDPRDWQIEASEKWIAAGRLGVIEAVTGTGKTKVGILLAADAVSRGKDVLILVPGTDLMQQWLDVCQNDLSDDIIVGRFGDGYKDEFDAHHIIISTIQSAKNQHIVPDTDGGLLIADEVHGYGTPKYSKALREEFDERLGLTATFDRADSGIDEYLAPYFWPPGYAGMQGEEVIVGCDYARGLDDKILAPFKVALIGVDLEPDEQKQYDEYDNELKSARNRLIHRYDCPKEPFGDFIKEVQEIKKGKRNDSNATRTANNFLRAFTKRRALLAGSEKKLEILLRLTQLIKQSNGTLLFTETKESARNATRVLQDTDIMAAEFTSDYTKEFRRMLIELFRNAEIQVLAAPKILDEGIDLPEADTGIIIAASHSKRQMIQRMGRIIRPKANANIARFIIIYVQNTNEDPEYGTHDSFLSEMIDHALDIHYFTEYSTAKEINEWFTE